MFSIYLAMLGSIQPLALVGPTICPGVGTIAMKNTIHEVTSEKISPNWLAVSAKNGCTEPTHICLLEV